MKKTLFLLACAAAAISANAQQAVVKDAEKAMKSGKDFKTVTDIIRPAQTNAETAKDAAVYYIPGKAGFNQYDAMLGKRQLGMLADGEELVMSEALLSGYDNFMKALPLDTVVDAKGKVKTKYSKDIYNVVSGHYNDFPQAGVDFYNAKDYKNAYKAWDDFIVLSEMADKYGINVQPDSIVSNFMLNNGLAAWQMEETLLAAQNFKKAIEKGYDKENAYQYGMSTAIQSNSPELIYYFATVGNEKFGETDSQYINSLINYYLQNEKYDDAIVYLDAAIAKRPNAGQYYALEGIIYDGKNDTPKAMELYKKALELDPKNGLANYYYGRSLALEASARQDEFKGSEAQYQAFLKDELIPAYNKAIGYLETAYEQDPNNRANTLQILEQMYYITNNEAGMKSVEDRKLNDE